jgi:DeoR/GlpR family transcriptional regulator of sugar metabolism
MHPEERHERILAIVTEAGRVDVDGLCEELGVSPMTVRRDLAMLEAEGAVRRVYRGATKVNSGSYEPPFAVRTRAHAAAKRRIAAAVRDLIDDGQTVILDAGTTGVAIAEQLAERYITVCTPSLRVAATLVSSSVRLLLTGGILRPGEQSLVGPAAVRMLEDHHFDLYVMTASGIHVDHGFTEWNSEDAAVKRAALRVASNCIAACDASKIGHTAFARICGLEAVGLLVTDAAASDEQRTALAAAGLEVRIAASELPDETGESRASRRRRSIDGA